MAEKKTERTIEQITAELAVLAQTVSKGERAMEAKRREFDNSLMSERERLSDLREQGRRLHEELEELRTKVIPPPFNVGDVVVDEFDVRFRVTFVKQRRSGRYDRHGDYVEPTTEWYLEGIRLTKTGVEAYAKGRELYSPNLTLVDTA